MVSPACCRVTMSPKCIRRRHTYGAQYDSENCTRRREKRAANLRSSTQTLPCSKPVIVGDGSLFPVRVGRRKRREFLGPRFLWTPCGATSAPAVVAGHHLLSY